MSYDSRFRGEITITPPLTAAEIRSSGLVRKPGEWRDIKLRVHEEIAETDEGTLTRRTADALIPGSESEYSGYDFAESLGKAVDRIAFYGHHVNGTITRLGEDQGDVERWVVPSIDDTYRIRNEKARLYWPDGSPVEQP